MTFTPHVSETIQQLHQEALELARAASPPETAQRLVAALEGLQHQYEVNARVRDDIAHMDHLETLDALKSRGDEGGRLPWSAEIAN